MVAKPRNITQKRSFWQRFNPLRIFKRGLYTNVGTFKDTSSWSWLWKQSKANVDVNEVTVAGIPALYRAFNVVSEQIASLPRGVYEQDDNNIIELHSHPLNKLMNGRPHPLYDSFTFLDTFVRVAMIRGNSYARLVRDSRGALSGIELIECSSKPDIFESNGVFWYQFPEYTKPLRTDEVLHLKGFTLNGYMAERPTDLLKDALGLQIAQIDFAASHFGNGAHYSGILIPDGPLKPEQRDALKNTFNNKENKPGEVGVVPFGVKYQPLSQTMAESQLIDSRRLSTEDVSNITGVPLFLLANHERSTFSNGEQQMRTFVQYTLRTWCKRIESEINTKVFTSRERNKFFRFNLDGLLRGDTEARAKLYQVLRLTQAISPNEIRKMENMNPYQGGDRFDLPFASNIKTSENNEGN